MTSLLLGLSLAPVFASGAPMIESRSVDYVSGREKMEGYVAYQPALSSVRPGVLIVHQWAGLTEYEMMRARQLAELGYVAFCVDIYGKGVRPEAMADRGKQAGFYKGNRPLFRERLASGLKELTSMVNVDKNQIAVIGYCFGGTGALELARAGADVKGAVSFHGGLDNPTPENAKNIKAKVLVLHGADDPFVPKAQVDAFKAEMKAAKKPFEFVAYPGAVHSFTHKDAGNDPKTGAAYNEEADKKSWAAMLKLFNKIFKTKTIGTPR
jgi:dienelactone hydrolase